MATTQYESTGMQRNIFAHVDNLTIDCLIFIAKLSRDWDNCGAARVLVVSVVEKLLKSVKIVVPEPPLFNRESVFYSKFHNYPTT